MFFFEYEIFDEEKERLKKIKSDREFELDFNNIVGQIQLQINDKTIGFVDKEIPYDGELILTWLKHLNSIIVQLDSSNYVAMTIPDSANVWIEFEEMDGILQVTKMQAIKEANDQQVIVNTPKKRDLIFWSEYLPRIVFFDVILESTNKFIQDIASINKILLNTRAFKELDKLVENAKEVAGRTK